MQLACPPLGYIKMINKTLLFRCPVCHYLTCYIEVNVLIF
jgi:hypothetical protein